MGQALSLFLGQGQGEERGDSIWKVLALTVCFTKEETET